MDLQEEQSVSPMQESSAEDDNKQKVKAMGLIDSMNLAEDLDDETLKKIGECVIQWYEDDEDDRKEWKERNDKWMKLATQVVEKKSYPWPDAANVKFPLLTTASMQFAARAYPALVPGPNLVAGLVIGRDDGSRQQSAKRIGSHMSYQLLYEMENWEEDMDRLCIMLPIAGCLFKKSYYDPIKGINVSELVSAKDLVIDYYAKSVETATRKSHIIYRTKNQIQERINRGLFCDVDLEQPQDPVIDDKTREAIGGVKEPTRSSATPHKFIECHCFWDLDEDEYDEPYIVTVHCDSKQVVRIVARFDADGIKTVKDEKTGKEKLVAIEPLEYFTKFGFIPNPDGSIYDLGFGILLGGINESVNTLTNQLLDSGTLHNLQAGFLGRGIRVRSGNSRFIPGEWKPVDFTGDDIKKHIFPLPTKEPSDVLFKLLEALVTSGKELASVAEIMVGKMPGQNTPATTTMATIEQGLKVFTAIYKRIYRALGKEYQKLFRLNSLYLDEKVYFTINEPEGPQEQSASRKDYQEKIAVKPNADPNIVSSAQKLMKVQSYGPLLELKTINPKEYTKRFLEAVDAENIKALMQVEPPQPSAEEKQAQMEMQQSQQEHQAGMQQKQMEAYFKQQDMQQKLYIQQMEAMFEKQSNDMQMRLEMFQAQMKEREAQIKLYTAAQESKQTIETSQTEHDHARQLSHEKLQDKKQELKDKAEMRKKELAAKPAPKKG